MVMQQQVHTVIKFNNNTTHTPDLSLAGNRPLLDTTTKLLHARTVLLHSQEKKICTNKEKTNLPASYQHTSSTGRSRRMHTTVSDDDKKGKVDATTRTS